MTGLTVAEWIQRYGSRTVRETWLARTPPRRHKALALPVMPITWRIPRQHHHDWLS